MQRPLLLLLMLLFLRISGRLQQVNGTLMNEWEPFYLSLEKYFQFASETTLNSSSSSPNISSLLEITLPVMPLNVLESSIMKFTINGSQDSLCNRKILQRKAFYSQAIMIMLLNGNTVLLFSYSIFSTLQGVSLQVDASEYKCHTMETHEVLSGYYLIVGCDSNDTLALLLYELTQDSEGLSTKLVFRSKTVMQKECSISKLTAITAVKINSWRYSNIVALSCAQVSAWVNLLTINEANQITILGLSNRNLSYCLSSDLDIVRYEAGFLSIIEGKLFKFGKDCLEMGVIENVKFMVRMNSSVYIISNTQITVLQENFPNFWEVDIEFLENLSLKSYAITTNILTLHFQNKSHSSLYIYDITSSTPKLIDTVTVVLELISTSLTLFSTGTYRGRSDQFFIFDAISNKMNLTRYEGYELVVNATPSAVNWVRLVMDCRNDTLEINLFYRGFNDTNVTSYSLNTLVVNEQIFKVELGKSLLGPLGRFYTYPSNASTQKYINSFSELYLGEYMEYSSEALLTAAISLNQKKPILSFYYAHALRNCVFNFSAEEVMAVIEECQTFFSNDGPSDSKKVIVLEANRYLQYGSKYLKYCEVLSNNEIQCSELITIGVNPIYIVKLVKYSLESNGKETVEVFLVFSRALIYYSFKRAYSFSAFVSQVYLDIGPLGIKELSVMTIVDIYFDSKYESYLLLELVDGLGSRTVILYDRPLFESAQANIHFIGHEIWVLHDVTTLLHTDHTLILLINQLVQEHSITSSLEHKYMRRLPLYGHVLVKNGRHAMDGNYLYLQILSEELNAFQYLAYCISLDTPFILTHSFESKGNDRLMFLQKIGQNQQDRSIGLNGEWLFALCLPNLIVRLGDEVRITEQVLVSLIDNRYVMNVLPIQFIFDRSKWVIAYDTSQLSLVINEENSTVNVMIEDSLLQGPVSSYELVTSCPHLAIRKHDIFTKSQCLLLNSTKRYGVMQDFLSFESLDDTYELIVTDTHYLCVTNRIIKTAIIKNKTNSCKMLKQGTLIFSVCDTQQYTNIYRIQLNQSSCGVTAKVISRPSWLRYQHYSMTYVIPYMVLAVPIQDKTIYYSCLYDDSTRAINDHYAILQRDTVDQFQAKDVSAGDRFFFLLEKGIGLYDLNLPLKGVDEQSKTQAPMTLEPFLWISLQDLQRATGTREQFVYIKYISTSEGGLISIELGSRSEAYQLTMQIDSTFQLTLTFIYLQYINCFNDVHSKSRPYLNLIIKTCKYMPEEHYVFSNFISITEFSQNMYIQFYNLDRQPGSAGKYPFRMEVVYSDINTNDNFEITAGALVVGSLFNFMCYYDLNGTVSWQVADSQQTVGKEEDQFCQGYLQLANLNYRVRYPIIIEIDRDYLSDSYWLNWTFNIQRIILLALLANFIRVVLANRNLKLVKTKKKQSNIYEKEFEIQLKLNSKKSL